MDWTTLFTPVVIALIPIIVLMLKRAIPERYSWVYPLLATALGPALDYVSQRATGVGVGGPSAVLLGLSAVGLREIVDQVKKAAGAGA